MTAVAWLNRRYPPKPSLTPAEVDTGLTWLVRNGIGGQMMDTLTVGAFMTAFALDLGATNLLIGLLAAIPHLTQFIQLAGVHVAERVRNRRGVSVILAGVSRPMFLIIAAAAFVPDQDLALVMVSVAFVLRYAVTALMSSGWNSWLRDLVPEGSLGRFFGRRLFAMTVMGTILGLGAAALVDFWPRLDLGPARHAYALLFVLAFLGGSYSVYCMTKVPEPAMAPPEATSKLWGRLGKPFRDANYRRLMMFLGSWNFAVNLAAPFFIVHMLQRLHLDLLTIMILATISQTANVAVLKWWGSIADRMSNKSVLQVCAPLFIACIFAWTFTTFPDTHALTLPLLVAIHILTGFATAGVTLASGNIALKLAPRGDATAYLANNSLVNSMAAGIAPVIGGLFADFFTVREMSLNLHWRAPGEDVSFDTLSIGQWDFFFLLATIVGLYSIHRLRMVREVGEVGERMVLHEALLGVKRSVRNLSTIAGLRSATEYPFGAVREETATDDSATPPARPSAPGRATLEARAPKLPGGADNEVGG